MNCPNNNPEFENYLGQITLQNLRSKTPQRAPLLLLTWIYYCRLEGMVNFTFRSTTNEIISISISQTLRSSVLIFHLRQPMAFLSLILYDTPGLAPRTNIIFWGPGDFLANYSIRDNSWKAWTRLSGRFFWSIRGSYSAIWSISLMIVKWHSDPWPTVTSQPIRLSANLMTLIP